MKTMIITAAMLIMAMTIKAQLVVNDCSNVRIDTNMENLEPLLMVGYNSYFAGNNISVGTAVAPDVQNKKNVGVYSSFFLNGYNYTSDKNFGVLGVVKNLGNTHGRYYGLCGMIGNQGVGNCHGGAGIYGADNGFALTYPDNINGLYAAYFVGQVRSTNSVTAMSMFTPTDSRLCSSMTSMNEAKESGKETLENLLKINVVEYNLKSRIEAKIQKNVDLEKADELEEELKFLKKEDQDLTARRHIGIVGQELQKVYPNLVLEGQDGYLSVNYLEIVPLLIRSIQELKQELDEVKEADVDDKSQSRSIANGVTTAITTGNILYQNTPNPFKEKTVIRFQLADDAQNAAICIYDLTGKQLKKMPISSGETSVSVNGWELGEGMFLYTLLVNGQEIDTKRMIITK